MSGTLRLGTRSSRLALAQAASIAELLASFGARVEFVRIETAGDRDRDSAFADVGAAGIFVREVEAALLDGRIDLAVHSFKDLPSDSPASLVVAAVPPRADPRDRLLVRNAAHDAARTGLPIRDGACVGTSAARRAALVRALRPDLVAAPLRGNVTTRIARLAAGDFDAIVLAAAGLDRLATTGFELPMRLVACDLDPRTFVPAPSQGALAIQTREGDAATRALVARLDDPPSARVVALERALLARFAAGCAIAFGAFAEEDENGRVTLHGLLERDGVIRRARATGTRPEVVVARVDEVLRAPVTEASR